MKGHVVHKLFHVRSKSSMRVRVAAARPSGSGNRAVTAEEVGSVLGGAALVRAHLFATISDSLLALQSTLLNNLPLESRILPIALRG